MIDIKALFHDTTAQFLNPPQADPGETVTIRLRTSGEKGSILSVDLIRCVVEGGVQEGARQHRSADPSGERNIIYVREPMELVANGSFGIWEVKVRLTEAPLRYFFEIRSPMQKVSYDRQGVHFGERTPVLFRVIPGFHTPAWAEGAVMYQIFTDRFCNGSEDNDVVDGEYFYGGAPVKRIRDWFRQPDPNGADVREFYGGDLQGIIDKLDYLWGLGVEAIYLNPVFVSPSNHKYDVQDYQHIDPHFGKIISDGGEVLAEGERDNKKATRYIKRVTSAENLEASDLVFAKLIEEAHRRGIRVIIDGVFNHCGSFNKWMDREGVYASVPGYEKGAYSSKESPYRSYFTFRLDAWPDNRTYEGWWDYDTLPKLNYEGSSTLEEEILSVARKWVSPPYNADGWRLDVAADLGHSEQYNHDFWRKFRAVVKGANPDAVIIAEHYGDAQNWLSGGEWDSVMNYDAFMEPVSYFFTGMEKHSDEFEPGAVGNEERFWASIMGSAARNFTTGSLYMAMNQLSNHDHSRFLTRTNGKVGRSRDFGPADAETGVSKTIFRQAVLLQMTWPGAPTLYYGDEVGLCGFTDPDNRRTYPWGREDKELLDFHRDAIRIRRENPELRSGSLMRLDSQRGVLAYGRFLENQVCLILINRNEYTVTDDYDVFLLGVPGNAVMRVLLMTGTAGYHTAAEERYVKRGILTVTLSRKAAIVLKYADGMDRDEAKFRTPKRRNLDFG